MCDCLGTLIVHRRETPLIVVIGVGYVGEHLVNVFSRRFNVIGYDISPARAELLSLRFQGNRRVLITSSTSCLRLGTHFLIAVPTLLRPDKTVDSSFLRSALEAVASNARPGSTVVIESSVAVGMTRQLLGPIARSKRFYAGMSPERVDPGRTEPPAYSIPKIVSGLDDIIPGSLYAIRMIYNAVFDTVISVSKPEVAEMTKLYENCQRMVCIAFANEMADACGTHGISSFEVCEAASTKPFGYMPMTPSLGVGGHCIPVNPYYLLSTNDFPLLEAATARMNARPALIAHQSITRLYKRLGWRLGHDPDVEARHSVVTPPDSDSERGAARRLRRETDPAILEALRHFGDGLLGNGDQQAPYGSSTETLGESDESLAARQAVDSPPPLPHLPRVLVVGIGFKAGQSHLVNSPGVALAQSLLASKKVSVKWCDPLVTQLGFAEIPRFDESFWTKSRLEEAFDMIIVAFRQHGLDFGVLQNLHGVDVEMWCP
ncbi:UDP-N-acetyl-D-glucosamine 6-dehydrogenase [Escovopsis weberi]|uniref:UDP-N-acetyl-D-glucosamine 6-dehydrogenase n=1 Tax=Escovopsis weberi TaxID=150374 RepID=A0A0N0RTY2_ESCWE|nr:UDP-N-acetyl-D-glucosamine 6-dehydrogenase [Escovopsis weberi]